MDNVPKMEIQALNDAESSENRIHSDEIALKYGFTGALVSGVNVYGYLTQPMVKHFGPAWLETGIFDVIFRMPAYQGDRLQIKCETAKPQQHERHFMTTATNQHGDLLARLESWLPKELPGINDLAYASAGTQLEHRNEIQWDLIHILEPGGEYLWQPGVADNKQKVETQRDKSEIYTGSQAFVHPYYLLDACNKALMRMFILPAWIHTGSRLTVRQAIKVGQNISIRAIPVEKWERKGHQFIKLYIAMLHNDQVAIEVDHTAIFKIAV